MRKVGGRRRTRSCGLVPSLALFVVAVAGSVAPAHAAPRGGGDRDHLLAAERLVNVVEPADNVYVFGGNEILWKGEANAARYEVRTDCSGLLNLLLARVYGHT